MWWGLPGTLLTVGLTDLTQVLRAGLLSNLSFIRIFNWIPVVTDYSLSLRFSMTSNYAQGEQFANLLAAPQV